MQEEQRSGRAFAVHRWAADYEAYPKHDIGKHHDGQGTFRKSAQLVYGSGRVRTSAEVKETFAPFEVRRLLLRPLGADGEGAEARDCVAW